MFVCFERQREQVGLGQREEREFQAVESGAQIHKP